MVEIIDMLIDLLCQQGTAAECSQFISQYPEIAQQLVWLVFFPTVFLILFIFFISEGVVKSAKKYRTLLAIAIYLFIIFQGWYHYILTVSRFWFIGIIIIGGIFVITHKMGAAGSSGGGSSGGGTARAAPAEKMTDYLKKRMKYKITGKEKEIINDVRKELDALNDMAKRIKKDKEKGSPDARGAAALYTEFRAQNSMVKDKLDELKKLIEFSDFKIGSAKVSFFEKKYFSILKSVGEDVK